MVPSKFLQVGKVCILLHLTFFKDFLAAWLKHKLDINLPWLWLENTLTLNTWQRLVGVPSSKVI